MGPRSNRIEIAVYSVRASYVSRKVFNPGGVVMTLAVVWFGRDGGGASRQLLSREAVKNAGRNPDAVKRLEEVSKDLRRGTVTLANTGEGTIRQRKAFE